MPQKKYFTEEERLQALREYSHNYYLRRKQIDKEYINYFRNYSKKYYENNKDKCREAGRINYEDNKERNRAKRLERYYNNREKEKEYFRMYKLRKKQELVKV